MSDRAVRGGRRGRARGGSEGAEEDCEGEASVGRRRREGGGGRASVSAAAVVGEDDDVESAAAASMRTSSGFDCATRVRPSSDLMRPVWRSQQPMQTRLLKGVAHSGCSNKVNDPAGGRGWPRSLLAHGFLRLPQPATGHCGPRYSMTAVDCSHEAHTTVADEGGEQLERSLRASAFECSIELLGRWCRAVICLSRHAGCTRLSMTGRC